MKYAFILLAVSLPFALYPSPSFWNASAQEMEAKEGECDLWGDVELETDGFYFHAEKMRYDMQKQKIEAQDEIEVLLKESGVLHAQEGILLPDDARGILSGGEQVFYEDTFNDMPFSVSSKSCMFFWNDTLAIDTILFLKNVGIDLTKYATLTGETVCVKKGKQGMRFFSLLGEPSSLCTLRKGEEAFFVAKSILYDALLHKVSCFDVAGGIASLSFDPIKQKQISFFSSRLVWKEKKNSLHFPKGGVFSIPGWGKIESDGSCIAYLHEIGKKKEVKELCARGKTRISDESLAEEKFRSLLFGGTAKLDFVKGLLVVDSEGEAEDKVVYQDQNLLASANRLEVRYTPKEKGYTPTHLTLKGAVHIAVAKRNQQLFSVFADSVNYHLKTGKLHIESDPGGTILCVDPSSSYQIRAEKMTLIKTKKGFEVGKVEGDMRVRLSAAELELMRKRILQLQTLF